MDTDREHALNTYEELAISLISDVKQSNIDINLKKRIINFAEIGIELVQTAKDEDIRD